MSKQTRACHCCDGTGKELDPVGIGQWLRVHREARSLTLREVARRMKLSGPYLSDLERGRRNWNDDLVNRFKEACQ